MKLTPKQAAQHIGCDNSHIRRMIRAGKLKATKFVDVAAGYFRYEIAYEDAEAERRRYQVGNKQGRPRGKT